MGQERFYSIELLSFLRTEVCSSCRYLASGFPIHLQKLNHTIFEPKDRISPPQKGRNRNCFWKNPPFTRASTSVFKAPPYRRPLRDEQLRWYPLRQE